MFKRLLMSAMLLTFIPFAAAQDAPGEFVEGTHYDVVTPHVRTTDPKKVEVLEFFWYGCGHCYNFEPLIGQWKKGLADDVDFRGSPAIWNKPMELHAKAYYTAEVLGVLDPMHMVLFQAMNVDRKRLTSDEDIEALFVANGVSEEEFEKAFGAFGVSSMVRQANSRARAAKITGTPEMLINGKYRVSTRKAGSQANMLKIADYLIEKERAAAGS